MSEPDSVAPVPLISIITIVRNDQDALQRTISSVLEQKSSCIFEHVLVDGASQDGTQNVIEDYAQRHPQLVRSWVSEPDDGISDAFNKGIRLAIGSWLCFLNAGDRFAQPTTLSRVEEHISTQGDTTKILTAFAQFGADTIPETLRSPQDPLPKRSKISHQASIVHRCVFEQVGGFDLSYQIRMDYEFWLRALRSFSFQMVDDVWVDYATGGLSGQRSTLHQFYAEEKRANQQHHIPAYRWRNALLNGIYWKDLAGRSWRSWLSKES